MPPKPKEPVVTILVDGKPALTVERLLHRYRDTTDIKTIKSMRSVLNRADGTDRGYVDKRTPVYVVEAVDFLIANRPGKGNTGRAPDESVADQPPKRRTQRSRATAT